MKRMIFAIIALLLIAVPLEAAPLDNLGGVFDFLGEVFKSPVTWSVAGILSAVLAFFIRDWKPEHWRKAGNKHGFFIGRWVSVKITAIPAFGMLWQAVVEKWIIKILAFVSAYVASFFIGIVSGLASDNKDSDKGDGSK